MNIPTRHHAGIALAFFVSVCSGFLETAGRLHAASFGPTAYSRSWVRSYSGSPNTFVVETFTDTWAYGVGATQRWEWDSGWEVPAAAYPDGFLVGRYKRGADDYVWYWTTNGLAGAWRSGWNTNRLHYTPDYTNAVLDGTTWTNEYCPANYQNWLPSVAPNGSYPANNGDVGTNTFQTQAAIFTDGVPGATNQSFYRIRLSLQDEMATTIPLSVVSNWLGRVPDTNGNIYVWLPDGAQTPAAPTFNPGMEPPFYSYDAAPFQAQKLGTLVVATITRGATWSTNRPAGMAAHMGYPTDEGAPSDDQLAFDYIMNSSLAGYFTTGINALLTAGGIPLSWEKDQSRGQIGALTDDERKYLVLALLARSTNPEPPSELDYPTLAAFIGTNFVYRLVNEFSVEAAGYQGKLGHDVVGPHILRKQARIGKTKLELENDVILRLKIWPGLPIEYILELGLEKDDINAVIGFVSGFLTNDPGGGHDTLYGGSKGLHSVRYMCAAHAGTTLRSLEQPLLRRIPHDFSCMIRYWVSGDTVTRELRPSLNASTRWPTFFEYHYDFEKLKYIYQAPAHAQIENPFDGFLVLGE